MIRSILVALDDTPGAQAARDVAIALSRRTGAALTAATVLDRPHIKDAHEPVPRGGSAFKERRDARLMQQAVSDAEAALRACTEAARGQPFAPLMLEDAPEEALLAAGAAHDLIVIGRDSTLGREEDDDGLAPVIQALLKEGARPLLVVPPGWTDRGTADGVIVAYDGSIPAMRALQLFALLGLDEGSPVQVLSVADDMEAARSAAAPGAVYLQRHGIKASAEAATGMRPVDALTTEAAAQSARLLVAGAYGTTGLKGLFFGTTTQPLLRAATCPIFIHH